MNVQIASGPTGLPGEHAPEVAEACGEGQRGELLRPAVPPGGVQNRSRSVAVAAVGEGVKNCSGGASQTQGCNHEFCPKDCQYEDDLTGSHSSRFT